MISEHTNHYTTHKLGSLLYSLSYFTKRFKIKILFYACNELTMYSRLSEPRLSESSIIWIDCSSHFSVTSFCQTPRDSLGTRQQAAPPSAYKAMCYRIAVLS